MCAVINLWESPAASSGCCCSVRVGGSEEEPLVLSVVVFLPGWGHLQGHFLMCRYWLGYKWVPCLEGRRRIRAGMNFSLTWSPLFIYLDLAVAEALLLWPVQGCVPSRWQSHFVLPVFMAWGPLSANHQLGRRWLWELTGTDWAFPPTNCRKYCLWEVCGVRVNGWGAHGRKNN